MAGHEDLILSREDFAEEYLGLDEEAIAKWSQVVDEEKRRRFWESIEKKIADDVRLRPDPSDDDDDARTKILLKKRALALLSLIRLQVDDAANASAPKKRSDYQEWATDISGLVSRVHNYDRTRIGHVSLGPEHLDPVDIRIQDIFDIRNVSTMRAETDAAVKEPGSTTLITLDLIFSGADDINKRLRHLIGGLTASPITTIESPFITAALVNHYSSPEMVKAILDRITDSEEASKAIEDFRNSDENADLMLSYLEDLLQSGDMVVEYMRQKYMDESDRTGAIGATFKKDKLQNREPLPDMGVSIPVAFRDIVISTDSEAVDTLHVRLSFIRINPNAFGINGLEYRDAAGNRTPDVSKCPWLGKYVEWAYFDENNNANPEYGKNPWYMEEYGTNRADPIQFLWEDINDPEVTRSFPGRDHGNMVISGAQVSFSMKVAVLPIIGSRYPAVQIMGRGATEARVVLQTTDLEIVRAAATMKDHLDAISRAVGGTYRDEKVQIVNDVLNLVAARHFLIRSAEFFPIPETTDAFQIEFNLLEARYGFEQQQTLMLRDGTLPRQLYEDFWGHLWDKYQAARAKLDKSAGATKGLDPEEAMALRVIFGTGNTIGLFSPDVFIAAAFNLAHKEAGLGQDYNSPDNVDNIYEWFGISNSTERTADIFGSYSSFPSLFEYGYPGIQNWNQSWLDETNVSSIFLVWEGPAEENPTRGSSISVFVAKSKQILEDAVSKDQTKFRDPESVKDSDFGKMTQILSGAFTRPALGISRKLWDSMLEVMLHQKTSPRTLSNAYAVWATTREGKSGDKPKWGQGTIWLPDGVARSQRSLSHLLAEYGYRVFPSFNWAKYAPADADSNGLVPLSYNVTPHLARRLRSNYPDIPLPTYRQFFAEGAMATDPVSGKQIPLWQRFAPTYSDLGLEPPYELRANIDNTHTVAKAPDDCMEPGFWFFHHRTKEQLIEAAKKSLAAPGGKISDLIDAGFRLQVDIDTEDIQDIIRSARQAGRTEQQAQQQAVETLSQRITSKLNEDATARRQVAKSLEQHKIYNLIDNQGRRIAVVKPANAPDGDVVIEIDTGKKPVIGNSSDWSNIEFDRRSNDANIGIAAKMMELIPDNIYSMARAYPALRVYFVEWDDNAGRDTRDVPDASGRRVTLLDDLYTSNAITSVHITHSKDEPSVAIVEVLNTVGTFDRDTFITPQEAEKAGVKGIDDEGEDFLRRLRLQTGTGIQIDMGYSSDLNALRTVFTGQIVEIQQGKVITFIAQGYQSELNHEIVVNETNNTGPREAIQKILEIESGGERINLTPHLGRLIDRRGLQGEEVIQAIGRQLASETGFLGTQGRNGWFSRNFGRNINSVSRNVWIESSFGESNWLLNQGRNLYETFGGRDKEWRFQNMTAWEGLQEMSRHFAGTICAVRPFGPEATVFFGYPDQLYQARNATLKERQAYVAYMEPIYRRATQDLHGMLARFWESEFGTRNSATKKAQVEAILKKIPITGKSGYAPGAGPYVQPGSMGLAGIMHVLDTEPEVLGKSSYLAFVEANAKNDVPAMHHHLLDNVRASYKTGVNNVMLVATLSRDFREDWQRIPQDLKRFLFSYFFNLRSTTTELWPGSIEGKWQQHMDLVMGSLMTGTGHATEAWQAWTRVTGADNGESDRGYLTPYSEIISRDDSLWLIDTPSPPDVLAFDTGLRPPVVAFNTRQERIKGIPGMPNGSSSDDFGRILFKHAPYFRLFIHYFAAWLRDSQNNQSKNAAQPGEGAMEQAGRDFNSANVPVGFRPFRNYHTLLSETDIIDNSIVASMSEMHNCVTVRCPDNALPKVAVTEDGIKSYGTGTTWIQYPQINGGQGVPFHPNIKKSSRKLGVAIEPNANSEWRRSQCLLSNMALGLRPMYRGSIKFVGRNVFPWDVLLISDTYNSMHGYIEADRVTHEFTASTGWITTVEPHAYCHANNPYALWHMHNHNSWLEGVDVLSNLILWGSIAAAVFTGGTSLVAGAKALAAKRLTQFAAATGARFWGGRMPWLAGKGSLNLLKNAGARGSGKMPYLLRSLKDNWYPAITDMAKWVGKGIVVSSVIPPGARLWDRCISKFQIGDTFFPVDLKPLSFKGEPFVAGLDLTDEDVLTFGEKTAGLWYEFRRSIDQSMHALLNGTPEQTILDAYAGRENDE